MILLIKKTVIEQNKPAIHAVLKSNSFELSPGSRQEVNLHCEHSKFLPICPTMKIANF